VSDPLPDTGSEIFFCVRTDRIKSGNHQHRGTRELQDGQLIAAYRRLNEVIQPAVRRMGPQHTVEDNLQRPWFEKVRYSLANHGYESDGQSPDVWLQ